MLIIVSESFLALHGLHYYGFHGVHPIYNLMSHVLQGSKHVWPHGGSDEAVVVRCQTIQ